MHRGPCYVESEFKNIFFLPFYFFTFKEQPCWLNIPLGFFLPFYLFTFLLLKSATAGNSERSSDGCKEGYCNLQNRLPGICFHHL